MENSWLNVGDKVRTMGNDSYDIPERIGTVIASDPDYGVEIAYTDGTKGWMRNADCAPFAIVKL